MHMCIYVCGVIDCGGGLMFCFGARRAAGRRINKVDKRA